MWKFKPILKESIWGGDYIPRFKNLEVESANIGESWELSALSGSESVVSGGPDSGLAISELLARYGSAILGEKNYSRFGTRFPLLIKFIDARSKLSVQVHPDNELAKCQGHENGKEEMWYIVKAAQGAKVANGFREPVKREEYDDLVKTGEIENKLYFASVSEGDVFYIPAGRVHTIGAGCFVAEIQQTSDATYRMYDYHRKDKEGKERELNTELAKEAIDFNDTEGKRVEYLRQTNLPINLVKTSHFTTNIMNLNKELMRDYSELDSFVVLVITEGSGRLICGSSRIHNTTVDMEVKQGDTVLVSASAKGLTFFPAEEGMKLLETYVS